jgi:2-iminobutanoate/2-iminopropanoate deaminase
MPDRRDRRGARKSRRELIAGGALGLAAGVSRPATAAPAAGWTPKKAAVEGCIRSGPLLFVSGIGGYYPAWRPRPGDIREQTGDALRYLKGVLEKAGTSLENVLQVRVSLVDPQNNIAGLNEVYETFFKPPAPARSHVGATGFSRPGALLQIDCIAYID